MDIFPFIRIEGADVGVARIRSPWAIRREALPGGVVYAVRRGSCWFEIDEPSRRILLGPGDVVAVARRRPHVLRGSLETPVPERSTPLVARPLGASGGRDDGAAAETEILVFRSAGTHPLERVFPAVVHVPADGSRDSVVVRSAFDLVEHELADGPAAGSATVVQRAGEILAVALLRAAMSRAADDNPAWLAALGDPQVMHAVAAMHERPGDPWTVGSLAKQAGLSRSAFVERFRRAVGEAPMQHLLATRMRRAAVALLEGEHALPEIASSVGYESESAFHRAFRRIHGVPPGHWRSAQREARDRAAVLPFPSARDRAAARRAS